MKKLSKKSKSQSSLMEETSIKTARISAAVLAAGKIPKMMKRRKTITLAGVTSASRFISLQSSGKSMTDL